MNRVASASILKTSTLLFLMVLGIFAAAWVHLPQVRASDGVIKSSTADGSVSAAGSTTNTEIEVGDTASGSTYRGFVKFPLSSLSGLTLGSVILHVYVGYSQHDGVDDYADPLTNPGLGDCLVRHIDDYGTPTSDDYSASSIGNDPGVLISSTATPNVGYVSVDVTAAVVQDIGFSRSYSSFMIKMATDTDSDSYWDTWRFRSVDDWHGDGDTTGSYIEYTIATPTFDFSLSNDGDIAVTQGASGQNSITATAVSGPTEQVDLSCTLGLPMFASCGFSPSSGNPTFSSTLTVSTTSSTPTGVYTITITGEDQHSHTRTTQFTLTVNTPGLHMVVRGKDSKIYWGKDVAGTWTGWNALPGTTPSSPAATSCGGHMYIAVRGSDNGIYYGYVTLATKGFSGWLKLSGSTPSAPALTSGLNCTLYLVVRGGDNGIYVRKRAGSSWSTTWTKLPGSTVDTPAAAATGTTLHFAVLGSNGFSIYHGRMLLATSAWVGWTKLSGSAVSPPALHGVSDTEVYMAVQGSNNKVYLNTWTGAGWTGWSGQSAGTTPNSPAIADVGADVYVAVRGSDSGIYKCSYNSTSKTWTGWSKILGSTPNSPALA